MKSTNLALAFLSSASSVAGHAFFQQLWVNNVDQETSCVRLPLNNSPVVDVMSTDMRCNAGTKSVANVCEALPGDKIAVEMHQQRNDRSCANEAIGGNHFGPVLIYLSKVASATDADGSAPWFKVAGVGYGGQPGTWGTDLLNDNCGKFEFTIPTGLAAGDYLLRAEAIALHTAGQEGGAQFYMSCYQLRIGGSGGSTPAGVNFPGAYSASDPGIKVDIWRNGFDTYVIPGPDVATV